MGTVLLALAAGLMMTLSARGLAQEAPPEERVVLPAMDVEFPLNHYGSYSIDPDRNQFRQPDLVVLGTVRRLGTQQHSPTYEVAVEKVLQGSCKEKTLRFGGTSYFDDSQRQAALPRHGSHRGI